MLGDLSSQNHRRRSDILNQSCLLDQYRRCSSQCCDESELLEAMAQRTKELIGGRKPSDRRTNRSALGSKQKKQQVSGVSAMSLLPESLARGKLEDLMQEIVQKEIRLKELDERVERRKRELEELEVQYSKRIGICKREHLNVSNSITQLENTIRNQNEKLMDIQTKIF